MKILLIDDTDQFRQYMTILLDGIFTNVNYVEAISGNQGIEILSKQPNIQLIICDYMMVDGNGSVVYQYVKDQNLKIPFILYTSNQLEGLQGFEGFPEREGFDFYLSKFSESKVIEDMFKSELALESLTRTSISDRYQKIKATFFWRFNKSLCDIYIKLSDEKFVKIVNKNDSYSREDILKYTRKSFKYLYVKKEDTAAFSKNILDTPFLVLDKSEASLITTHAVIHELALEAGISKNVVELTQNTLNQIIDRCSDSSQVHGAILKMRNKNDYLYDHSYLLACVCLALAKEVEWRTQRINEKLCIAAIFHDIFLENAELARLEDLDESRLSRFSQQEVNLFKSHTIEASKLVNNVSAFPSGVDKIILNHHEKVNGAGMPRGLDHQSITPVEALFIIAHDFVSEIYNCNFDVDKYPTILDQLQLKYKEGNFKNISDILRVSFSAVYNSVT